MSDLLKKGRKTKKPDYDLPLKRGDKLVLPPLPDSDDEGLPTSHTVLDLFCGAGGMSLGFMDAGFDIALGIDRDKWAIQTYAANVSNKAIQRDLSSFESRDELEAFLHENGVVEVTGIIGGPPCQGFSRVGKGRIRHRDRLNGHDDIQKDHRNDLYRVFIDCVAILKPTFFVMENVPDLDRYVDDDGVTILADRIEQEFSALDYVVGRKILHAVDFGVPQARSRLFFMGIRKPTESKVPWPDEKSSRAIYGKQTLRQAIGDLPIVPDGHTNSVLPYTGQQDTWLRRWYRAGLGNDPSEIYDHITRPHREDDKEYFQAMEEGQKYTALPPEYQRYRSDIFKDKYRKLVWNEPSWTITAHIKRDGYRYIHPDKTPPRTISLREAARIQSFPDRWRFCGHRSNAFDQIGNAVPPLLSRAIARSLKAMLDAQPLGEDPLLSEGS